jgi:hypothetical protein
LGLGTGEWGLGNKISTSSLINYSAYLLNNILSQKQDYIASLEQIHAESLAAATEQEKLTYQKAKELLE